MRSRNPITEPIERSLEVARKDAGAHERATGTHLGAVFVVPRLSLPDAANPDEAAAGFVSAIKSLETTLVAWAATFPVATRTLRANDGSVYPGGALLLTGIRPDSPAGP